MGAKMITPATEIERYIQTEIARRERLILRNLAYVGEQCLNQARSTDTYRDQTGNLRSSTGYIIAVDGKVVQTSHFDTVKNGQEGSVEGKAFAMELVSEFPTGVVLIVVAGMNYAASVSAKGYDVIDSAELLAQRLVPQIMKKLMK
jgi:hypothetical protein